MGSQDLAIQSNLNLSSYNTLNVHANARNFAVIKHEDQLKKVLENEKWNNPPMFVLGGGSNVLFLNDYEGLVLHIAIKGKEVIKEDDDYIWLSIGAGENWHQTVRYCVEKGWGGIENLSLIPGTAGAAPIQNIGAYGVELSDVFEELIAIELKTANEFHITKSECDFGYRDSIFKQAWKNRFVVTRLTLRLSKNPELHTGYGAIQQKLAEKKIDHPTIKDISDVVIEIRNSKLPDPAKLANAGSFFKNPIIKKNEFERLRKDFPAMPGYSIDDEQTKVPAGWLIEQAGWKGKKVVTYRQQALVIVNLGGADGKEIWELAQKIRQSVRAKFNIDLAPEVNIVP